MTDDAPRLKACPFCGSKAIYRRVTRSWETPMFAAACVYGCATSVDLPSKKEAAEWWNRRKRCAARITPRIQE